MRKLSRALACVAVTVALGGCASVPRGGGHEILGEGLASFYGPGLYGHRTASGARLEPSSHVAAHRTLPFGTCLTVQRLENGRVTRVQVADRGPFVAARILDVSEAAATELGMRKEGVARVRFWRCD